MCNIMSVRYSKMIPQRAIKSDDTEGNPADHGLRILAAIIARHHMVNLHIKLAADKDVKKTDMPNETNDK